MLFPALGMTTAVWLLAAPLVGLETGGRAELAVAAGIVASILAPLGIWFRPARIALTALGILLGFANFVLDAPMGSLTSLATCAVGLIAAGTAARPVTMPAVATQVAAPASAAAPGPRSEPARLPAAA